MLTPAERKLRASIAANSRWSREDRTKASERQRLVLLRRFEDEVDPEGKLADFERATRAQNALQAHMQRLALRSARARRAKKAS